MDKTKKLVEELRRTKVEPSVVICSGCEHEQACGVYGRYCGFHGCALMREAADTIEQLNTFDKSNSYRLLRKNRKLEERLVEMKNKLRWRVASHELPQKDESVLVCVNGIFGNISFNNAIQIGFYAGEEGWIIDGYEEWENANVSHWMPLPDMPIWDKDERHE